MHLLLLQNVNELELLLERLNQFGLLLLQALVLRRQLFHAPLLLVSRVFARGAHLLGLQFVLIDLLQGPAQPQLQLLVVTRALLGVLLEVVVLLLEGVQLELGGAQLQLQVVALLLEFVQ